jgi:regulatory protein
LKARALRYLAQREHSRLELRRKLGPHAESAEQVDGVLDELEQGGFLSAQRFVESLVNRRAARFGSRRIEQELGVHALSQEVSASALRELKATERDRALAAWRKRFGEPAADPGERARQHRFLAQRGFASDAIQWVLRHGGRGPDGEDEPA